MSPTNHELIGRDDVNDLEAILAITNTDVDAVVHSVGANLDAVFTWDYERSRLAAREAVREGEDVAVERVHRPRLVDRRRPGSGRARQRRPGRRVLQRRRRPVGHAVRQVDREGVDPDRHREPELDALAVPARRAGRVALHRAHRRDRAVDRRQVLRGDADDGRGPSRRGVRAVPRREAHRALPDQRAPAPAARRHPRRQPLGHDVPRHADHGRGPRARRVRLHAPDDDRAAAEAAAALRHERRSAPRRVRRALAEGVLHRAHRRRDAGPQSSSRSRPRCACATGSSSRRSGTAWAST